MEPRFSGTLVTSAVWSTGRGRSRPTKHPWAALLQKQKSNGRRVAAQPAASVRVEPCIVFEPSGVILDQWGLSCLQAFSP